MVMTHSTMRELGFEAPDFELSDVVSGATFSRDDYADRPLLVTFICNHCPAVRHIEAGLGQVLSEYDKTDLGVVAICSNDLRSYPVDGPEAMAEQAERAGFTFPYLLDDKQDVARAFGAACTPDFFLFDASHTLVYRGRFDGSSPGNDEPVDGAELRAAIDALIAGRRVPGEQLPSMGCNIKWRE